MSPAQRSIQWVFDLEERGQLFHLDDDPATLGIFTEAELPAVRLAVADCFAMLQDPFYFLCEASMDAHDRTELVFFEHNGHAITNPTMSECGRFSVSPAYYGFTVWHTGGSCTAWRLELADERYLLLTDSDGGCGSTHQFEDGEPILLGLYEDECEPIAARELAAGAL